MSVNYGQIILLLQSAPARAFSLFRERGYIDMAVVSAPHAPRHRHVTTQRWHSVAEGKCQRGLPWWLSWSRICLQCRRPGFHTWVGIPVLWPGEFPYQRGMRWGRMETDTRLKKCFQDCLSGQGQTRYPQVSLTGETSLD